MQTSSKALHHFVWIQIHINVLAPFLSFNSVVFYYEDIYVCLSFRILIHVIPSSYIYLSSAFSTTLKCIL